MVRTNYHNSSSDDEEGPKRQPQFGTTTNFGAPPVRVSAGGVPSAFETTNMASAPVRVAGNAPNYETMNLGPGPVRVDGSAFETVNFDAVPVRVADKPNDAYFGPNANFGPNAHIGLNANAFNNIHSSETPMVSPYNPIQSTSTPQPMPYGLVVANVILRPLGFVFLLIATGLIVSNSNFKASTTTKYLVGALILGIIYEVYQTISAVVRIIIGRQMLPGSISLYISYILDQIFIVLLLTAGAASAAYLKDLDTLSLCEGSELKKFCNQTIASTSLAFLSFLLLGANSIISSFCFFTNKI